MCVVAGAKEIDIAATLEHLRDQRPGMVQTKVLSASPWGQGRGGGVFLQVFPSKERGEGGRASPTQVPGGTQRPLPGGWPAVPVATRVSA